MAAGWRSSTWRAAPCSLSMTCWMNAGLYSAQVSPDGSWVVFDAAIRDEGPERDIFIVAANGGTASPLAAHPGYDWSPFWTPDGRHVLFLSRPRARIDGRVVGSRRGRRGAG